MVECLSINLEPQQAKAFRHNLIKMGFRRGKNADLAGFGKAIASNELYFYRDLELVTQLCDKLLEEGRYDLVDDLIETFQLDVAPYPRFLNQIKTLIKEKQPFRLEYLDVAGKPFLFDCCGARLAIYEKKQYLEVRFINELESSSIPGLKKNRCLRIDRIPENSQISKLKNTTWQDLEEIKVTFILTGNLALSYQPEPSDVVERISEKNMKTKLKITSVISNDFWFIRKFLQYGGKAEILSPKPLRDKMTAELHQLNDIYLIDIAKLS